MADEGKRAERGGGEAPTGGRRKGRLALFGVVGGVMLLEGVGIFALTRVVGGGPSQASGASSDVVNAGAAAPAPPPQELALADIQVMNQMSGRTMTYVVKVVAAVDATEVEAAKAVVANKQAAIEDKLAQVVRAAEPQFFKEAGLETLRRQFKHAVDPLFDGQSPIKEILIPKCMWYPTDS